MTRGKMRNYAPEAIEDKNNYCVKSDVYMLGLIMWEMLQNKTFLDQFTTEGACKEVSAGRIEQMTAEYVPKPLSDLIM